MKVPRIFAFPLIYSDNFTNSNRSVKISDFFCDYLWDILSKYFSDFFRDCLWKFSSGERMKNLQILVCYKFPIVPLGQP